MHRAWDTACRPGWFDTMGWIQRDVPEPCIGWSRPGHFLLDLTGNKSILNCFCASSVLWTEVSCLHNVFSFRAVPPEPCRLHSSSLLISNVTLKKWHLTLAHIGFLCALKVVFALSTEKTHFYYRQHSRTNKAEAKGVVPLCFMHHCQENDLLRPPWAAGPSPCPRKGWHRTQTLDDTLYLQLSFTAVFSKPWNKPASFLSDPEASGRATGSSSPVLLSAIPQRNSWATSDFCHFCIPRAFTASPGAQCTWGKADTHTGGITEAQPALLRTDLGLKEGQRGLKRLIPETFLHTGNSVEEEKVLSSSPCLGSQFWMWNLKHLAWNSWNIGLISFAF